MEYKIVNVEELVAMISMDKSLKEVYEDYKGGIYEGFELFSPQDKRSAGDVFVVAVKSESNEICGVIKTKRFAFSGHRFVKESEIYNEDGAYKSLSFQARRLLSQRSREGMNCYT